MFKRSDDRTKPQYRERVEAKDTRFRGFYSPPALHGCWRQSGDIRGAKGFVNPCRLPLCLQCNTYSTHHHHPVGNHIKRTCMLISYLLKILVVGRHSKHRKIRGTEERERAGEEQ